MADLSGKSIRGYDLNEMIGHGGYGQVYRAFQPIVKREVAVKVILPEYANEPDFIRGFEAEAQVVARLEHPHIIPLFDYWRDSDGAYLVMRYLRAGSAHEQLRQGRFEPQQVANLLQQIASALALAHRSGVIHRDIKPDNILLDKENNAYLTDFGIAKNLIDDKYSTSHESLAGTPEYWSPEQLQGQPTTPQSDIYSLGITLYEMLAGHHPYSDRPRNELWNCHLHEPLPLITKILPDLPDDIDDVLMQSTAKDPADRYPTVLDLAQAFSQALRQLNTLNIVDLNLLTNPYKGLRTFEEADSGDFFGREGITKKILDLMSELDTRSNFLALMGPSGSGKSSLVNAGIVPSLRQGAVAGSNKWFITQMYPGAYPFEELEAVLARIAINPINDLRQVLQEDERGLLRAIKRALPADNSELLLIIDGFEEIFTLVDDEAIRIKFLDCLRTAVLAPHSRLRVLILLRADYIDGPLRYAEFGNLINQRSEFILPLSADELEHAIVGPAKRSGLQLENGLTASIIRDVGMHPGGLPLLQYALTELYEMRRGRMLTLEAYRASGGVAGALARRAEQLYLGLDEKGQKATLQLFMRLVNISPDIEIDLRTVTRTDLTNVSDPQAMESVIELYGKYRLLTFDRDKKTRLPTVELAHESLLWAWERLQRWLDVRREDLLIERSLMSATTEWLIAKKDSSYLSSGARLARFVAWAESTDLELTQDELNFIAASSVQQERLKDIDEERSSLTELLSHDVTRLLRDLQGLRLHITHLRRQIFMISGFSLITLLILLGVGVTIKVSASKNDNEAQSSLNAFRAQIQSGIGNNQNVLQAALAAANAPNASNESFLTLEQIAYAPAIRQVLVDTGDPLRSVAVSPNAQYAIVGTGRFSQNDTPLTPQNQYALALWDLNDNMLIEHLDGHSDSVYDVVFASDNQTLYSASADKTIRYWQIGNPQANRVFATLGSGVLSIALSDDGKLLAAGSEDGMMSLWNTSTGSEICQAKTNSAAVWDIAFSPNGKLVASASGSEIHSVNGESNTPILWDAHDCGELRQFTGHTDAVLSVAFSPDGSKLISSSADHSARIWDVNSGQELHDLIEHLDKVTVARFSPDGKYALTGSLDAAIVLWDANTGTQVHKFSGDLGDIRDLAFVSNNQFVSVSKSGNLSLWDMNNALILSNFALGGGRTITFDSSGSYAMSGALDGTIYEWNPKNGKEIAHFSYPNARLGAVDAIVTDPLGNFFVSAHDDLSLMMWGKGGNPIREFSGHTGRIRSIAISPDGKLLASASEDGTVRIWDVHNGKQQTLLQAGGQVYSVAFSPNGKSVLFSGAVVKDPKGSILFTTWDIANRVATNAYVDHEGDLTHLAISKDGKTVAVAGTDNKIILWDVGAGKIINTLSGHNGGITGLIFDPDTNHLISSSSDQTLRIWDWEKGVEQSWVNYGLPILSLAIDPNDQTLLMGSTLHDAAATLPSSTLQDIMSWLGQNRAWALDTVQLPAGNNGK